ncbi:MAG: ribose 5-phosphate isomerase A [Sphingomonas sp. 28-66-16]|nr:MAG: ribose 5-phosphate isomerase A [Sphingomonas sp. 28-66-16]
MIIEEAATRDTAVLKRMAALAAVAEVVDGMIVGLGTGTTAAFAIDALGERAKAGLRITTVATSLETARAAEAAGLTVMAFDTLDHVDIGIDGADELDHRLRSIKGGGGALLREKIVATAAGRMIAIVDDSKLVGRLGAHALPVEVLPFAAGFVTRRIEALGASVVRRMGGGEPYGTDQQNAVLDCDFGLIEDPEPLALALSVIPGLLGHGLFLDEFDIAYVAAAGGVQRLMRNKSGD